MNLGTLIDDLYAVRAKRLELGKQLKELQALESLAKQRVLNALNDNGLAKASGEFATASIQTTDIPIIVDWEPVYEYIKSNNRFDLLQKRIGVVAWRDLFNDGILVPGTEQGIDTDLSLTKSSRK